MIFRGLSLSSRALLAVSALTLALLASLAYALELQVLGFSFAFALLTILPLVGPTSRLEMDPFRPHLGLSILLFLYSISTLIFVENDGLTYYGESVSDWNIKVFSMACILCMAGISFGTLASNLIESSNINLKISFNNFPRRIKIYKVALVVGLIFSPFVVNKFQPWSATSYADVALSLRVENLADHAGGIKEILFENIPTVLILAACTLAIFDRHVHRLVRLIAFHLFVAYLITSMLSGWRGSFVFAILMIAIYINWRVRLIKIKHVISLGIGVYLIMNILSVARVSSNPLEMLDAVIENFDKSGLAFLAISQSGELATSTNLLRLIAGIESGESKFGYGSVALNQMLSFIPRVIWPERPPIGSELFVQKFYPGVFESGGGYGFFLPQDGYWDFGLFGVFLYSLFLGLFLEAIYKWFYNRKEIDFLVLFYAILYSQLVLSVVRSGIFASFKAAIISSIPFLVMWIGFIFLKFISDRQTMQTKVKI